jgi:hypothetical protein
LTELLSAAAVAVAVAAAVVVAVVVVVAVTVVVVVLLLNSPRRCLARTSKKFHNLYNSPYINETYDNRN